MRQPKLITVSKVDAARWQVDTAIRLFFDGKDPVSIHTLLYASVEIIHGLYKRATGKQLLFDNNALKGRPDITRLVKDGPNFFKHGRPYELDRVLNFNPESNFVLFSACMAGLDEISAPQSDLRDAFAYWLLINKPDFFHPDAIQNRPRGETLRQIRRLGKKKFLEHCLRVARKRRRWRSGASR